MRAAGKQAQHVAGVGGRGRFAKDVTAEDDDGVGAEDDGRAGNAFRAGERLFAGESRDVPCRGFAAADGFVNTTGTNDERESGVTEDFRTARGSGGKDQAKMARVGHGNETADGIVA